MSEKTSQQAHDERERDYDYHERCRVVATALNLKLVGSTFDAGFSYRTIEGTHPGEIGHAAMVGIERLLSALKSADDMKEALVEFREISNGLLNGYELANWGIPARKRK